MFTSCRVAVELASWPTCLCSTWLFMPAIVLASHARGKLQVSQLTNKLASNVSLGVVVLGHVALASKNAVSDAEASHQTANARY